MRTAALLVQGFCAAMVMLTAPAHAAGYGGRYFPEGSSPRATGPWKESSRGIGSFLAEQRRAVGGSAGPLTFPVVLELAPGASEWLTQELMAVSDPTSPRFGDHATPGAKLDALRNRVRPPASSLAAVERWASSVEGCAVDPTGARADGTVVVVSCPGGVAAANALLGTEMTVYTHSKIGSEMVRARGGVYSVPAELEGVVSFVGGVARFERFAREEEELLEAVRSKAKARLGSGLAATPKVLRALYNTTGVESKSGKSSVSVTALIGQFFSPADLEEFYVLFSRSNVGRKVTRVIGPDNGGPGIEAGLDVQTVGGTTDKGVAMWFWSIKSPAPNSEPFLEWVNQISNTTDAPYIHTTSYGGSEAGESPAYLFRMDDEFKMLGVRGLTLLFASGDSGAGCGKGGATAPDWPASSTYVTAVGGTKFSGLFESGHEVVNGLSGGGFSNVYPTPPYQAAAVQSYLQNSASELPKAYFNRSGRAYPDIAALSAGFVVVEDHAPVPFTAGTSCASPTVAGVLAYVNDYRLANGKPVLGFLNPTIYASIGSGAFNDITEGKNNACPFASGFPAAKGFDAASGVGSPSYSGIINFLDRVDAAVVRK